MADGMRLVMSFVFEDLQLHRIEADIQPMNVASVNFAHKVGFQKEGYSPDFIYVHGAWRDHERWAITSSANEELPT